MNILFPRAFPVILVLRRTGSKLVRTIFYASLISTPGFGTDAYTLCMSPKPPEGFKLLVKESIYIKGHPEGFTAWGNDSRCKELAKQIESETGVDVINIASSGPYLSLFKSIGLIRITENNPIKSLKEIGSNDTLNRLIVIGPLRLTDFKDLIWYNNRLKALGLQGTDENSFVDLADLGQFAELSLVSLRSLRITNGSALDRIPKLDSIILEDITVDELPTFAHLQPNGVKELKNIKIIKESRTPSGNKTK